MHRRRQALTAAILVTLACGAPLTAARAGLFIAEYAEGTGNNKYIEIFNDSGVPADLSAYQVRCAYNGQAWTQAAIFTMSGALAAGDVFVLAHASAGPAIRAFANATYGNLGFNGDDAVGLWHDTGGGNWVLLDAVGIGGERPANGWAVAGVAQATMDRTLVRKNAVTTGNTNWASSAGANADDAEWIVHPVNTWSFIGFHREAPPTPPVLLRDPSEAAKTVPVGATVAYTLTALDMNADTVTLSALNVPAGAAWSAATAVAPVTNHFTWTPAAPQTVTVTFVATDQDGAVSNAVTLTAIHEAPIGLFIAELCDPYNNFQDHRYIEIYNPRAQTVSLDGWRLVSIQNGVESAAWALSGALGPGKALVCGHVNNPHVDVGIVWNNSTWNGGADDGAALYRGATLIDHVLGRTHADSAMTRKAAIARPSVVFTPEEWTVVTCDDFGVAPSTPGTHACVSPGAIQTAPTLLLMK